MHKFSVMPEVVQQTSCDTEILLKKKKSTIRPIITMQSHNCLTPFVQLLMHCKQKPQTNTKKGKKYISNIFSGCNRHTLLQQKLLKTQLHAEKK